MGVVHFDRQSNGALFRFTEARTPAEVASSAGSVYHPVEISQLLRIVLKSSHQSWAIVGVPCLCAALRNIPTVRRKVPFLFSLACGMYQNTMYTEYLVARSGLRMAEIAGVRYREKRRGQPVRNFAFRAYGHGGKTGAPVAYQPLPALMGRHGHFRLNACNFCRDVFAETADAVFMDAWLPENAHDTEGDSIVIARSEEVIELLQNGKGRGVVRLSEIPADQVVLSQSALVQRKRGLIEMRIAGLKGRRADGNYSVFHWLQWRLQQLVQHWSRLIWRSIGRQHGPLVYWCVMSPLAALQLLVDRLSPTSPRPRH